MNTVRIYFFIILTTTYTSLIFSESQAPVNNFYMNQNNNNQNTMTLTMNEIVTSIKNINWGRPKEYATNAYSSFSQFLRTAVFAHKLRTCFIVIGSAYATLLAQLEYVAYKLDSSDSWSLWKRSCTLEELLGMPQSELAQELLIAVQKRYSTIDDLYDFITPMVSFINYTDKEIKLCKKFLALHSWISYTHLTLLFPHHEQLKTQTREKINRLAYLKSLLLNWLSEHKIAMNKPKKHVPQDQVTP